MATQANVEFGELVSAQADFAGSIVICLLAVGATLILVRVVHMAICWIKGSIDGNDGSTSSVAGSGNPYEDEYSLYGYDDYARDVEEELDRDMREFNRGS